MKNLFKKLLLIICLLALPLQLCFGAAISTLTDNFNDNSIDAAKWETYIEQGSISEINNQIEITTGTGGGITELVSVNDYDATGSSATIKVIDAGNQILDTYYFYPLALIIWSGNFDMVLWDIDKTKGIAAFKRISGSYTQIGSADTYDADKYRYLKIRESGGTTYWDYSSDGINWTNFTSVANPITMTTIRPTVVTINTTTSTIAKVDDFNILPSATQRRIIFIQ